MLKYGQNNPYKWVSGLSQIRPPYVGNITYKYHRYPFTWVIQSIPIIHISGFQTWYSFELLVTRYITRLLVIFLLSFLSFAYSCKFMEQNQSIGEFTLKKSEFTLKIDPGINKRSQVLNSPRIVIL